MRSITPALACQLGYFAEGLVLPMYFTVDWVLVVYFFYVVVRGFLALVSTVANNWSISRFKSKRPGFFSKYLVYSRVQTGLCNSTCNLGLDVVECFRILSVLFLIVKMAIYLKMKEYMYAVCFIRK